MKFSLAPKLLPCGWLNKDGGYFGRISELLNFKIFWGSMPPDPPRKGGLWPPKYSQPPTIIWADAYVKSY